MKYGIREIGDAKCSVGACTALPQKMRKDLREISRVECLVGGRRNGQATRLMESVCREADTKKMILLLVVEPFGDNPPLNQQQLIQWYNKFGFHPLQWEPAVILVRMFDSTPKKPVLAEKVSQIITQGI